MQQFGPNQPGDEAFNRGSPEDARARLFTIVSAMSDALSDLRTKLLALSWRPEWIEVRERLIERLDRSLASTNLAKEQLLQQVTPTLRTDISSLDEALRLGKMPQIRKEELHGIDFDALARQLEAL